MTGPFGVVVLTFSFSASEGLLQHSGGSTLGIHIQSKFYIDEREKEKEWGGEKEGERGRKGERERKKRQRGPSDLKHIGCKSVTGKEVPSASALASHLQNHTSLCRAGTVSKGTRMPNPKQE